MRQKKIYSYTVELFEDQRIGGSYLTNDFLIFFCRIKYLNLLVRWGREHLRHGRRVTLPFSGNLGGGRDKDLAVLASLPCINNFRGEVNYLQRLPERGELIKVIRRCDWKIYFCFLRLVFTSSRSRSKRKLSVPLFGQSVCRYIIIVIKREDIEVTIGRWQWLSACLMIWCP